VPACEALRANECWPEGIEKDLECATGSCWEIEDKAMMKRTHAKKTLPKTLFRHNNSILVGKSVSTPS